VGREGSRPQLRSWESNSNPPDSEQRLDSHECTEPPASRFNCSQKWDSWPRARRDRVSRGSEIERAQILNSRLLYR